MPMLIYFRIAPTDYTSVGILVNVKQKHLYFGICVCKKRALYMIMMNCKGKSV